MKKATSRVLSLVLAFTMVLSLAVTTTFAKTGALIITLPEDTYGVDPEITISIYRDCPRPRALLSRTS